MLDMSFYKDRKVLVTGHTGFKGTWMCKLLLMMGAKVTGYALEAETKPSLFEMCDLKEKMNSVIGDIRDLNHLKEVFEVVQPEIVIHMAAQPLVRDSYQNPVYTYETNVMGTVNVLECIRLNPCVKSVINVTTDKVYLNKEWDWGYRETEELNGFDPYSNSKSCSELVTSSYINSFFKDAGVAVSTARAGNVIGGGDFAKDRIIPDCVRAAECDEKIIIRNPYSIRPYQHVLEPIVVYLEIARKQYGDHKFAGSYNVGPNESDCLTTGQLTDLFCEEWKKQTGRTVEWINQHDGGPHEATFLRLDCAKIKRVFAWKPVWDIKTTMEKIVEWSHTYFKGEDITLCMEKQIKEFLDQRDN